MVKSKTYTPKDWCIYYRNTLKNFIKQYYPIKDSLIEHICKDLLPKDTKTYMFWIEYSHRNIYLYISWEKINVSNYVKDLLLFSWNL